MILHALTRQNHKNFQFNFIAFENGSPLENIFIFHHFFFKFDLKFLFVVLSFYNCWIKKRETSVVYFCSRCSCHSIPFGMTIVNKFSCCCWQCDITTSFVLHFHFQLMWFFILFCCFLSILCTYCRYLQSPSIFDRQLSHNHSQFYYICCANNETNEILRAGTVRAIEMENIDSKSYLFFSCFCFYFCWNSVNWLNLYFHKTVSKFYAVTGF